MGYLKDQTYIIKNYQKEKPFASFLSGIAGKMGKPMWSFYVNRGQGISSFGLRDKNGSILEFYPANLAYMYTSTIGFRTFIKVDGEVYEFFKETGDIQTMLIDRHQLSIEEVNQEVGIQVKVTYFTLPNMSFAGLVRKVEIKNLDQNKKDILIVDGLSQILPAGIDYGGYKAVSNLLQSWMITQDNKDFLFFKLSASTGDSAEVSNVYDGNFVFTKQQGFDRFKYVYDYKLVFDLDSSFRNAHGLKKSNDFLFDKKQVFINQVPSAFGMGEATLNDQLTLVTVIGYASDKAQLANDIKHIDLNFLFNKEIENKALHDELLDDIKTVTAHPEFDAYLKQCYLDNLMRGGRPMEIEYKGGKAAYHLFSRKHGDLERDYNFFSLEPGYYSQGNGNFRDVLQNRRNDLLFFPEIEDFNVYQFGSLIQADGYNPLSIDGVKFKYEGKKKYSDLVDKVLSSKFSIGPLAQALSDSNLPIDMTLKEILKESDIVIDARFGEGYWQDHFTYLYDVIENFLSIYPDKEEKLLYEDVKYKYFNSPVDVRPHLDKYVLNKQNQVRQYDAIKHHHHRHDGWLSDKTGQELKVNLMGKLISLALNKFAALDPNGIGIMYEAGKPGWNDAMNGLPGLFASGVSETIELKKLVRYIKKALIRYENASVFILKSTSLFANQLVLADTYEKRLSALETYRESLHEDQEVYEFSAKSFIKLFKDMSKQLTEALKKAKSINSIYPTYLTYEAIDYTMQNRIGEYGLPLVDVKKFELQPIVSFLEAPARYISKLAGIEEAKEMYEAIKQSKLYDEKLKFYQTSVPLDDMKDEIGRIKAFQKGWLERESNFLHMTYKYLLALLKVGLYDEFYNETLTNFTCFMDPKVYGRNPLENSSFIATSSNLDESKHGQGFVARLSGSTAEMLSMWRYMFIGDKPFRYDAGSLIFELKPKLHQSYFKDGIAKTNLFRNIEITYINPNGVNTYDKNTSISHLEVFIGDKKIDIEGSLIKDSIASAVRAGEVNKINAYIQGGN